MPKIQFGAIFSQASVFCFLNLCFCTLPLQKGLFKVKNSFYSIAPAGYQELYPNESFLPDRGSSAVFDWLHDCGYAKSPIATANILPFNIICRYFGAAIRLRMPEQKCFRFHLHGLHSCTFVFTLLSYIRFGTPAGQAFMFCCGQRAEPCGGSANVLR